MMHGQKNIKHFNTVIKTSQLMTCTTKFSVCSEIRTKPSTQSEHKAEFLNIKTGGT
jgi:hypothetical protein